ADDLRRIVHLRPALVVFALEPSEIDEHGARRRLAGQRGDRSRFHHDTGHGLTCQMSDAYSAIVRSLENLPEPATFRIALRAPASRSAYSAQRPASASRYEARSARCQDWSRCVGRVSG